MRDVFKKVKFEAPDSATLKQIEHAYELRMQGPRAEYFSELLSVMKMSQLYFGDRMRAQIDALLKDLIAAEDD